MAKDIKFTGYTGDPAAIQTATPNRAGSAAEKIKWYAQGLAAGSAGAKAIYLGTTKLS